MLSSSMLDLLKCVWQDSRASFLCLERDPLHGRSSAKVDGQILHTMSRQEPRRRDLAAKRTFQSIKKRTKANTTQEPSNILFLLRSPLLFSLSQACL